MGGWKRAQRIASLFSGTWRGIVFNSLDKCANCRKRLPCIKSIAEAQGGSFDVAVASFLHCPQGPYALSRVSREMGVFLKECRCCGRFSMCVRTFLETGYITLLGDTEEYVERANECIGCERLLECVERALLGLGHTTSTVVSAVAKQYLVCKFYGAKQKI